MSDPMNRVVAMSHITTTLNVTDSLLSTNTVLRSRSAMLSKIPGARAPGLIIAANGLGTQQVARFLNATGTQVGELALLPGEQVAIPNSSGITAVIGADTVILRLFWYVLPGEMLLP